MHLWEADLAGLLTLPVLLALGIIVGRWMREVSAAARGDRAIERRRLLGPDAANRRR